MAKCKIMNNKKISGKIINPYKGDRIGSRVTITGSINCSLPNMSFWIAHRREYSGLIWPKEPKIDISKSNHFAMVAYEGGPPGKIVISLLTVPDKISKKFEEWLERGHRYNDYPGINIKKLPIFELDAIDVIYDNTRPLKLFYSYSHDDEQIKEALEKHLSVLQRQNLLEPWHDRCITPGTPLSEKIMNEIDRADIILLLVSSSFIASDYCYHKEMQRALLRHNNGEARVIPVIVRAVDWKDTPFSKLLALPTDGKPVKSWGDEDEAWVDVIKGIRKVIYEMR